MKLPVSFRRRDQQGGELQRGANDPLLSFDQYLGLVTTFGYQGTIYTAAGQSQENIGAAYAPIARAAYKANGIVFACLTVRQLLLSEARFAFRQRRNGRPGNLFTNADLAPLETPWPNATTGDLISRMELHSSLAGNWFGTNRYGGVRTLRPDWVSLVIGSQEDADAAVWDPDAEVIGYIYKPGGPGSGREPVPFDVSEVAHYAPIPDPEAQFRGMSWLTPVVREVMADKAATDHKLAFFENAATPNLAIKLDVPDLATYEAYIKKFREKHEGAENAYKTMFLAGGADTTLTVVGKDLQQMEFKVTQGAGETRIAAAARTPPAIVGLSEGLQGSSLNAGNFEASMRAFTDMTARPLWRNMAGSLAPLINVPAACELWYDDRDIPALQEDLRKAGERQQAQATAISTLIMAGYEPESVVDAVVSNDLSRLAHTGLTSVQLLPPGKEQPAQLPAAPAPPANGNGNGGGRHDLDIIGALLDRSRPEQHIHLAPVEAPDIHVHPADITVEPVDVNVTVEPARIEEGAIQLTVEPPNVEVTVERGGKKRVEFGDGRSAIVSEGDAKVIEYDDGRVATVTEVSE